jgi:protein-S-isoprenylcysteine O-methyltransferase Ste14
LGYRDLSWQPADSTAVFILVESAPMRFLLLPPVVLVMFVGLMLGLHWCAPVAIVIPWPLHWAGGVLIVAGLALANWHARLFRRIGTNINTFDDPGKLTTEGFFGRSRNPMYLGMVVCLVGAAVMLGSLSPWVGPVGFFAIANFWYVPLEERAMARMFGLAYAEYQQRVRRWL